MTSRWAQLLLPSCQLYLCGRKGTMEGKVDASGRTTMPRHCMVLGWIPVHQVSDLYCKCKARCPCQLLFNIMAFSSALNHCQYYQMLVLHNTTICFDYFSDMQYNVPIASYCEFQNIGIYQWCVYVSFI